MPVDAGSSNQVIQLVVTTSKRTHMLKSLAVSRAPLTPSFISPSQSTSVSLQLCYQHLFFPGSPHCLHPAHFHPSHPDWSCRQSSDTGFSGDSEPYRQKWHGETYSHSPTMLREITVRTKETKAVAPFLLSGKLMVALYSFSSFTQ